MMLISHASEGGGEGKETQGTVKRHNHAEEYKTVDKLFELMAETHKRRLPNNESPTTSELVFIYKKMDLGTSVMSSGNEYKRKPPNQHVETVVYEEHESDSDLSEVFSFEDLRSVVLINEERIGLINNSSPMQHSLCHKLSKVKMNPSGPSKGFSPFLLKDLYIEEQQKSLNKNTNNLEHSSSLLPATLLDYICSKRLQDNHNAYLENIIKYVKHTIDQLKKISNGYYLTEKAKEIWMEVENEISSEKYLKDKTITQDLVSSTTLPVYMKRNSNESASFWREIVHSELDIRSLSKILDKKIVVEIPKSICGSYRISSKFYNDDLIIRCRKERQADLGDNDEEKLDVVVKLRRSGSGHVKNNIQSILFLEKPVVNEPECVSGLLPLPSNDPGSTISFPNICSEDTYNTQDTTTNEEEHSEDNNETDEESSENSATNNETDSAEAVKQFCDTDNCYHEQVDAEPTKLEPNVGPTFIEKIYNPGGEFYQEGDGDRYTSDDNPSMVYELDDNSLELPQCGLSEDTQCYRGCDPSYNTYGSNWRALNNRSCAEVGHNVMTPDDFRVTMQRLNMQDSLLEDPAEGCISPLRKSPTRCRIKSPYENKSYVIEEKKRNKLLEIRQRREKKKIALTESCMLHGSQTKFKKSALTPQSSNSVTKLSITNKSFYNSIYGQGTSIDRKTRGRPRGQKMKMSNDFDFDKMPESEYSLPVPKYANKSGSTKEKKAEMAYMKSKDQEVDDQPSLIHTQTPTSMAASHMKDNMKIISHMIPPKEDDFSDDEIDCLLPLQYNDVEDKDSTFNKNVNSLRRSDPDRKFTSKGDYMEAAIKKKTIPVEFRKSIDKIYEIIKKTSKTDFTKLVNVAICKSNVGTNNFNNLYKCSISQNSDSGTSFGHQVASDPSDEAVACDSKLCKKSQPPSPTSVPKVVIRTKSQSPTAEKNNVLETRNNILEKNKKPEMSNRISAGAFRKLRALAVDSKELQYTESRPSPKDKNLKQNRATDPKPPQPKPLTEDRYGPKIPRKQVLDIVDEYKEARGEAVRGPPKLMSTRLNSLAQPKKHYVQAQFEQYQAIHGRNNLTDRLQRLASPQTARAGVKAADKNRQKIDSYKYNATLPSDPAVKFNPVVMVPAQEQSQKKNLPSKHSKTGGPNLKKKAGATGHEVDNHGRSHPTDPKNLMRDITVSPPDTWISHAGGHNASVSSTDYNVDSPIEGSAKVAKKINIMINSMMKPKMSALTECSESQSIGLQKDSLSPTKQTQDDVFSAGPCSSLNTKEVDASSSTMKSFKSIKEITKLNRRLPTGTFQKRLIKKIKRMTLSPDPSSQHTMLLQTSGDTNSIIVKANASRELKIKSSKANILSELNTISKLQKSTFDWTFTQIPMQITTVGYSFPQYLVDPEQLFSRVAKGNANYNTDKSRNELESPFLLVDSSCQCLKGNASYKMENRMIGNSCAPVTGQQVISKESVETNSERKWQSRNDNQLPCPSNSSIKSGPNPMFFMNTNTNKAKLGLKIKPSDIMSVIVESDVSTDTYQENITEDDDRDDAVEPMNKERVNENTTTYYPPKDRDTYQENVTEDNDRGAAVEPINKERVNENDIKSYTYDPPENRDNHQHADSCISEQLKDKIQYSTSLDVLVGLLNEIKKISTCQTEITSSRDDYEKYNDENAIPQDIENSDPMYAFNVISMTSLDKLRQLESTPSLYSYLLSTEGDIDYTECTFRNEIIENCEIKQNTLPICPKPVCVDKEISVQLPEIEVVHRCTDVPSILLPVAVNRATSAIVSCSAVSLISEPSTWSFLSVAARSSTHKKIVELQTIPVAESSQSSEVSVKRTDAKHVIKGEYKDKPCKLKSRCVSQLRKEKLPKLSHLDKCSSLVPESYFSKEGDFDRVMKIKRDVLVTMYSLLVFTVFAALSFPQVIGL